MAAFTTTTLPLYVEVLYKHLKNRGNYFSQRCV
jgi:hypothetical protein